MRLYGYRPSGNCYTVRLLLALLGKVYERVPIDIFGGDTLTDEFVRLNLVRETPVLGFDSGDVIVQSNAILWYLGQETKFGPTTALERAQVVRWLIFDQEGVGRGVGAARFFMLTGRNLEQLHTRIGPATRRSRRSIVARVRDQNDRRRVVVEITGAGARQLKRLDKRVEAAQAEIVAPLSAADRRELRRLLTRLVEHHSGADSHKDFQAAG
jgi:glutathione S-transferase